MTETLNRCRQEFERWALTTGFSVFTENGEYPFGSTAHQYWQCWQVAWQTGRTDYIAEVALQETASRCEVSEKNTYQDGYHKGFADGVKGVFKSASSVREYVNTEEV